MKRNKILQFSILLIIILVSLTGCRQASQVNYNLGKNADNFNITRRIVVYNARTDMIVFELVGNFSLRNSTQNELEVIVECDEGIYKKHFIYLNENTLYVIEDVSGAFVDKYHYEVNYNPKQLTTYLYNKPVNQD